MAIRATEVYVCGWSGDKYDCNLISKEGSEQHKEYGANTEYEYESEYPTKETKQIDFNPDDYINNDEY